MSDKFLQMIKSSAFRDKLASIHLVGTGEVAELETKLANHYGMKHALCVSNATTGLLALAIALDLKGKDFVTTPFTYGASIASFLLVGAKPIFADIDSSTLTLCSKSVKERLTSKTKMILTVDIFGHPSDSEALRAIADEKGLWLIADCAQSLGARRAGRASNHLADALVVSFTVGKLVFGGGEGGAVVTDNTELYQKLIWLSQHPYRQQKELGLAFFNEFAFNGRIHPVAAIWANTGFDSSLAELKKHQEFCFKLINRLNEIGLTIPVEFDSQQIEPTFFRLTAEWKNTPAPKLLERELAANGFNLLVTNNPVELLYQQNAFVAQYPSLAKKANKCLQAERQAERRFCLTNEKTKILVEERL